MNSHTVKTQGVYVRELNAFPNSVIVATAVPAFIGFMNVTIKVAVTHPSEFIVLPFHQQMANSS